MKKLRSRPSNQIVSLLSLFLIPGLLCNPRAQYSGNFGGSALDPDMINDIFGSSLDTARYGNSEEEWEEVPISLLPGHDDTCGNIQQARQEPQMMEMFEELHKIDVIKADGSKKCDFYRETEGYECVPYYQCNDGTIITDGLGLIDIRFGGSEADQPQVAVLDSADLMCPGSLDVCCKDPDFVKPDVGGYGGEDPYEVNYVEELEENENPYGPDNDNDNSAEDDSSEEVNQEQRDIESEEQSNDGYGNQDSSEEDVDDGGEARDDSDDLTDAGYNTPEPEKLVYQPQCGRRNYQGLGVRIQNYQDGEAQFGEWPHVCAVLSREVTIVTAGYGQDTEEEILTYVAGASLIQPGVIMTGAIKVHPFMEGSILSNKSNLVVRCGEWDTQTESEPLKHQDRNVISAVLHPEFHPTVIYNNIAVLFVETPFILGSHIDTICLPRYQENFDDKEKCFVKGWGLDNFGDDGQYQVVMKEVDLPMVANDQCQNMLRQTRLGRRFRLHSSFLCAGGEKDKDACRGDGGGPLVCPQEPDNEDTLYTQVGIVAWGIGCGQENVPGVYTNVASEVCWLDWVLSCREGYQHVLMNGDECNGWMNERLRKLPKLYREAYSKCPLKWESNEDLTRDVDEEVGYGK